MTEIATDRRQSGLNRGHTQSQVFDAEVQGIHLAVDPTEIDRRQASLSAIAGVCQGASMNQIR
ncbi:hypothetical protein [uncultured Brevundimonas sp.]|uniref:hypothetical protein n=1 Tax=uncultured Brevundimonas sp. TaxID=213418 RepID=UPI002611C783|nr:hypothetical protein [uncultured Brevundimonas sp.]